jgi:hypothetical protein
VCVCVCVCVVLTDAFTRFIIFNTTTTIFFVQVTCTEKHVSIDLAATTKEQLQVFFFAAVFWGGSVVSFPITGPSRLRSDSVFLLQ